MEENNNELQAPVVSLGEWIVTYILCMIPCVNIIMLFVWGFGGNTNPSKKNYARATLIMTVVFVVLYIILFTVFLGAIRSGMNAYN